MSSKRKRNSYDSAFKLKVIEYAENHNNCAAEREFGVTEKMVREWRKKKSELGGARKSAKRLRLTFTVPYKAMEDKLYEWVLECRSNGLIVTTTAIRLCALQLSKDPQFGMIDSGFKASPGWCHRFMKRRELALRQKTHIAQKLPSDVDTKVANFQKFIISARKDYDYPLSAIGKPREANGADDENEQTPDVISDDAQPDTFDELDNLYDDLYDDNVMTETEFHELFGDSDDEEWTYLIPDGRPC